MSDMTYTNTDSCINELEHKYPKNVHIINSPIASTLVAKLSNAECKQPNFTWFVKKAYNHLFDYLLSRELPLSIVEAKSRMAEFHKEGRYKVKIFDPTTRVACVDLARAGMMPTQILFEQLHFFLDPDNIRQDHIYAARATNEVNQVVGIDISGSKIGGDIENSLVIIPDPMGATGGTIAETISIYKKANLGKAKKYITAHLIITPEYIKRITSSHPDVEIYALRLDRGLSATDILDKIPGLQWAEEKGLNDHQYIVPGAGGVGELLNNSFV